ncbi:MAG: hypothetical protein U9R50_09485 [Campylobacterota bacterium]|nr:hypothetical protein [Campylobacterota bacterium]
MAYKQILSKLNGGEELSVKQLSKEFGVSEVADIMQKDLEWYLSKLTDR